MTEELQEFKKSDFIFSNKKLVEKIYTRAVKDYNELIETFFDNDYSFSKLKRDILDMRYCGKAEYDFDFLSLTITCICDDTGKIKIKTIRVYDLKTCDFLSYMQLKFKK